MTTPSLGLSVWNELMPPYPTVRVHVLGAPDGGTICHEDTGAELPLRPPAGLDLALLGATALMWEGEGPSPSDHIAAALPGYRPGDGVPAGLPGFLLAEVPVDRYAGVAKLRVELPGRDPVRFAARWEPHLRPPQQPQQQPRRRGTRGRASRP